MKRLLLLFVFLLYSPAVNAEGGELDLKNWSSLPVLYEGRVEPLDSFARVHLRKFSGKDRAKNFTASEWLAFNLFDPAAATAYPIHKIRFVDFVQTKELQKPLYSYADLATIIEKKQKNIDSLLEQDPENWTAQQKELITLFENYILHTQILRSLTLILPFGDNEKEKSFLDFKKTQQDLNQKVQNIVRQKGTDLEAYTDKEREISFLSYQLNLLEKSAENNVLLRIIPSDFSNIDKEWLAPWNILQSGEGSPQSSEYLNIWKNLASAYRTQNQSMWDTNLENAHNYFNNSKLKIEVFYNQINPTKLSLILFLGSLMFVIISSLTKKENIIWAFQKISIASFLLATSTLFLLIAFRVYLLERPPVGTLYESILFVALICALGFAIDFIRNKNITSILLGALSGAILMATAKGFVGDDPFGTLVAVLNTNFWLGTHVLLITMGYGTCLMASLMAHYDLWMRVKWPQNIKSQKQSLQNLKIIMILSLLLTTIGTILGGIWADQSWGRFWGWDPKENGALLIVLWLAWIIHSKISGHISDLGYVIGVAFLSIVIVLAWFGVNLLNVGLHSYGFISGVATGITLFCILQTVLIAGLWLIIRKRRTV
jgi:ABC-type transport system involved in cytochrome c biogenesis permease subunit